jgi:predicted metal-dependent hydrolase
MYPKEYLEYLIQFHGKRDYFECHEILEEYWKAENQEKKVWVGLIQIAVSLYHHRRNNFKGSLKMMKSAYNILQYEQQELKALGISYPQLMELLQEKIEKIQNLEPYKSFHLPLEEAVVTQCKHLCEKEGIQWGEPSNLEDLNIVHKHTLRDRSDVIKEREAQKAKKKKTDG